MNTDTLANLDLISREIDQKEMEKEDIVRSAAYQINLARFKKQYPQFPAPTCMVGISGQWGRGKSTLFILLLRVWMEFDLFNEVFFFSGSGTKDPKMKHFFPHDNKSTRTTPENIMGLLESFEKDNPENKELLASVRSALMPKAPSPSSKGSKKNPVVAATAVKTGSGVSKRTGPKKSHRGPAPKDEFDEKKLRALIKQTLRSNKIKVSDIDSERFENMSKEEQCSFLRKMVSPGKICFFDDSSGDKAILSQNSPIYRLVIMLRHLGACCAFAYHSWKDLPKKMRKQTSTNIVFPCPPEEQEAIGMATDLGAKAMEFLLTAMGRIPHVYLVIHDRAPADEKYWINFRVPLSERTIGEIVSAEELFRKSQRGNNASNGFSLGGGDSSTGGSAIVQSLLDQAPEIDVLNKDRPVPADKTLPLNLTPREQRLLPEARLLVAKVENFTYPLLPDPAKHLKKAAPPRKRRAPSSSTPRKKQKTTSATGTSQLLPSSHPMKDPIRPSSAQARTAAANFLHPSAVIANLARNRALAAGGRGIAAGDVAFAKASGDRQATRAAIARKAAAKRNPKVAAQIAKSTTGRPNTQSVAAAFRRGLLQGIRTNSRLSSRGLGPRRAAEKAFKQAQGGVRRSRGTGGGARGRGSSGSFAAIQDMLARQEKLTQAQVTAKTQAEEIKRLLAEKEKVPTEEDIQARSDEAVRRALELDEQNRRSAREEELLKAEAGEADEPVEEPEPDAEMGEVEPDPEVPDVPMAESDSLPEHPRNKPRQTSVSTGTQSSVGTSNAGTQTVKPSSFNSFKVPSTSGVVRPIAVKPPGYVFGSGDTTTFKPIPVEPPSIQVPVQQNAAALPPPPPESEAPAPPVPEAAVTAPLPEEEKVQNPQPFNFDFPIPSGPSSKTGTKLDGTGPSSAVTVVPKKSFKNSNKAGKLSNNLGVAKPKHKAIAPDVLKNAAVGSQEVTSTALVLHGKVRGGRGAKKSSFPNTIRPADTTAEGQATKLETSGQPVSHFPNNIVAPVYPPVGTTYATLPNEKKQPLTGELRNPSPPPKKQTTVPPLLDAPPPSVDEPSETPAAEPVDMTDE